ncbi:MAG: methyltransferase domain-containing protein [Pseudomonadota bacterium]
MLLRIRRVLGRMLASWVAFWRRLEGPELEPPIWHSHYLSHRVSRDVLKAFGNRLRGVVIDIGAGTGHGETYLDKGSTTYYPTDLPSGRDPSDRRISLTGKAPVHNCSVYELPFPTNNFGGGMILMVLEHLEWPQLGLGELFRVIEPGGLVLVSTPFAFPVHGAPFYFRRWTPAGLETELRKVGFEVEECIPCGAIFSSVTMNFHLGLRFHVMHSGPAFVQKLIALLLPLILPMQAITNLLALNFDRIDRSGAFPLAVVSLARKPKADR